MQLAVLHTGTWDSPFRERYFNVFHFPIFPISDILIVWNHVTLVRKDTEPSLRRRG